MLVSVPDPSNLNSLVWHSDLGSGHKRHQEIDNLPDEMSPDILGVTLWHKWQNTDILRVTGEHPVEHQLRQKRLQWFGYLKRMPDHHIQKQVLRCVSEGKTRTPGETQVQWVELLNRDLAEIPNWQELVQDRDTWRSLIYQNVRSYPVLN